MEKRHSEKELARYLAAEETACAKALRQKYARPLKKAGVCVEGKGRAYQSRREKWPEMMLEK